MNIVEEDDGWKLCFILRSWRGMVYDLVRRDIKSGKLTSKALEVLDSDVDYIERTLGLEMLKGLEGR